MEHFLKLQIYFPNHNKEEKKFSNIFKTDIFSRQENLKIKL